MTDRRQDLDFRESVDAVREGIRTLARDDEVGDALALVEREEGQHNLQGHAHSVVPLAVLVARSDPSLLDNLQEHTELGHDMGTPRSAEARDTSIWGPVQEATQRVISEHGSDIVSEELRSGAPQDVESIAHTYLSNAYGGGQTRGGGADTVLKRALKLMAHMSIDL